ncbi:MAG: YihY/virulence factor BrkB family protein [Nitrospirae bacterium]|nr:YihY/virulence factor BrkB family protein [Nitrospirota bacterium]
MKVVRLILRSCIDFYRDNGLTLAGSMSYFTMMAIVPLCIFLITVFGHLLGEYPGFYRFFLSKVTNFFPAATQQVTDDLATIISYHGLGKVSLALYGMMSYQVFASIESSLNAIFKIKKQRHVILSLLVSLIVVALVFALLTTTFAVASLIPLLKTLGSAVPMIKVGAITKFFLRFVLPFVLVMFLIMLLYVLVPRTRVSALNALKGAFFATLLLEVAKHAFTWYVSSVAHFGKIYGSLTAFVMFLLWMFYSSSIFLIGAEIVHNLQGQKSTRGEK